MNLIDMILVECIQCDTVYIETEWALKKLWQCVNCKDTLSLTDNKKTIYRNEE